MEKSETEILGELDALFALLDEAARRRAVSFLQSKHIPAQPPSQLLQQQSFYAQGQQIGRQ